MIVSLDVIRLDTVTAPTRISSQSPVNNDEGIIIVTTTGEDIRPLPLNLLHDGVWVGTVGRREKLRIAASLRSHLRAGRKNRTGG